MTTTEMITELKKDPEFVKSMAELKDPQKVYEALQAKGLTDSFEEFKKTAAEMKEAGSKMDAADVDAIVGGADTTTTALTATTVTAAASAAI